MDISPRALAARVFARYDANKDGTINAKEHNACSVNYQQVRMGFDRFITTKANMSSLFSAADNPQFVGKAEIIKIFEEYDKDNNGNLDNNELSKIKRDFPEAISVTYHKYGLCKDLNEIAILNQRTQDFGYNIYNSVYGL